MQPILLENMDLLDERLLTVLIQKHSIEALPRLKKLKNYYLGRHDIMDRMMSDPSKPNNRVAIPYAKHITTVIQGYFMGKPVTYTSDDDRLLITMQDIYEGNDEQSHNSLLSKDMSIYGVAYEMLYMNENNEVKFARLPVEETFMIYGTGIDMKPIGAVRYYTVMDYISGKGVTKAEVYSSNTVKYFDKTEVKAQFTGEVPHFFGEVPVNAYYNNEEEISDYEPVIPIINALDKAISDDINLTDYFSDAYLVISGDGVDQIAPADLQTMKENKVMLIPQGGDVKWLVKTADTTGNEAYKNRLVQEIHKQTGVPDFANQEIGGGEISGIALAQKFQGIDQMCVNKERIFKQSLLARQRMIVNILNIKGNGFDAKELKPVFTRNLPVNITEIISNAKALYGAISTETFLSMLPMVDDVQSEIKRMEEEKDELDKYDFDNLPTTQPVNEITVEDTL